MATAKVDIVFKTIAKGHFTLFEACPVESHSFLDLLLPLNVLQLLPSHDVLFPRRKSHEGEVAQDDLAEKQVDTNNVGGYAMWHLS